MEWFNSFICRNPCFEYGRSYDEGSLEGITKFLDVPSAYSCDEKCKKVKECTHWMWVPGKPHVCSLQKNYVRSNGRGKAISGVSNCRVRIANSEIQRRFMERCVHSHGSNSEYHPDADMRKVCQTDNPMYSRGITVVNPRLTSHPQRKYRFICKKNWIYVCLSGWTVYWTFDNQ